MGHSNERMYFFIFTVVMLVLTCWLHDIEAPGVIFVLFLLATVAGAAFYGLFRGRDIESGAIKMESDE